MDKSNGDNAEPSLSSVSGNSVSPASSWPLNQGLFQSYSSVPNYEYGVLGGGAAFGFTFSEISNYVLNHQDGAIQQNRIRPGIFSDTATVADHAGSSRDLESSRSDTQIGKRSKALTVPKRTRLGLQLSDRVEATANSSFAQLSNRNCSQMAQEHIYQELLTDNQTAVDSTIIPEIHLIPPSSSTDNDENFVVPPLSSQSSALLIKMVSSGTDDDFQWPKEEDEENSLSTSPEDNQSDAAYFRDRPRIEPTGSENELMANPIPYVTIRDSLSRAFWLREEIEGADNMEDIPTGMLAATLQLSQDENDDDLEDSGDRTEGQIRPPLVGQSEEKKDFIPTLQIVDNLERDDEGDGDQRFKENESISSTTSSSRDSLSRRVIALLKAGIPSVNSSDVEQQLIQGAEPITAKSTNPIGQKMTSDTREMENIHSSKDDPTMIESEVNLTDRKAVRQEKMTQNMDLGISSYHLTVVDEEMKLVSSSVESTDTEQPPVLIGSKASIESLSPQRDGPEPRPSSPSVMSVSSVASSKRLEWDSGADIGYGGPKVMYGLSTLERMAIGSYCFALKRMEPEGKSALVNVNPPKPATAVIPVALTAVSAATEEQNECDNKSRSESENEFNPEDEERKSVEEHQNNVVETYRMKLEVMELREDQGLTNGNGLDVTHEKLKSFDSNRMTSLKMPSHRSSSLNDLYPATRLHRLSAGRRHHSHSVSDIFEGGNSGGRQASSGKHYPWGSVASVVSSSGSSTVVEMRNPPLCSTGLDPGILPQKLSFHTPVDSNQVRGGRASSSKIKPNVFVAWADTRVPSAKNSLETEIGARPRTGRSSNTVVGEAGDMIKDKLIKFTEKFVNQVCPNSDEIRKKRLMQKILQDLGISKDEHGYLRKVNATQEIYKAKNPIVRETEDIANAKHGDTFVLKPYSPPDSDVLFYTPVLFNSVTKRAKNINIPPVIVKRKEPVPDSTLQTFCANKCRRVPNSQNSKNAMYSSTEALLSGHYSSETCHTEQTDGETRATESSESTIETIKEMNDRTSQSVATSFQYFRGPSNKGKSSSKRESSRAAVYVQSDKSDKETTMEDAISFGNSCLSAASDYSGLKKIVRKIKVESTEPSDSIDLVRELLQRQRRSYIRRLKREVNRLDQLESLLNNHRKIDTDCTITNDSRKSSKHNSPVIIVKDVTTRSLIVADNGGASSRRCAVRQTRDFGQSYPTPVQSEGEDNSGRRSRHHLARHSIGIQTAGSKTGFMSERPVVSVPVSGASKNVNRKSSSYGPVADPRCQPPPVSWFCSLASPRVIRGIAKESFRGRGDGGAREDEHTGTLLSKTTRKTVAEWSAKEPVSLQDAFKLFKSDVIRNVNERQEVIHAATYQRTRNMEIMDRGKGVNLLAIRTRNRKYTVPLSISAQHHRPRRRVLSHRQMREQTEKVYHILPEVSHKHEIKIREDEYRTNRLMARIYKKKLQEKVLKGQLNLLHTEQCL